MTGSRTSSLCDPRDAYLATWKPNSAAPTRPSLSFSSIQKLVLAGRHSGVRDFDPLRRNERRQTLGHVDGRLLEISDHHGIRIDLGATEGAELLPVNAAFDQGCWRRRPRGSFAPIARAPSSPRTAISLKWKSATWSAAAAPSRRLEPVGLLGAAAADAPRPAGARASRARMGAANMTNSSMSVLRNLAIVVDETP